MHKSFLLIGLFVLIAGTGQIIAAGDQEAPEYMTFEGNMETAGN